MYLFFVFSLIYLCVHLYELRVSKRAYANFENSQNKNRLPGEANCVLSIISEKKSEQVARWVKFDRFRFSSRAIDGANGDGLGGR